MNAEKMYVSYCQRKTIIPKANAGFLEIQYIYETECVQGNLNTNNVFAFDLGINNFVITVSSNSKTFNADVNGALNIKLLSMKESKY